MGKIEYWLFNNNIRSISSQTMAFPICSVRGCCEGPRGSVARHGACNEHHMPDECECCDSVNHKVVPHTMNNDEKKTMCSTCYWKYAANDMKNDYQPCIHGNCDREAKANRLCRKHRHDQQCQNCKYMVKQLGNYVESGDRNICKQCAVTIFKRYFMNSAIGASVELKEVKTNKLAQRLTRHTNERNGILLVANGEDLDDPDHKDNGSEDDSEDEGNDDYDSDEDGPDDQNVSSLNDEQPEQNAGSEGDDDLSDIEEEPDESNRENKREQGSRNPGNSNTSRAGFNPQDYIPYLDGKEAKEDRDLFERYSFSSDDDSPRDNIKTHSTSRDSVASRLRKRQNGNIQARKETHQKQLQKGRVIDLSGDD